MLKSCDNVIFTRTFFFFVLIFASSLLLWRIILQASISVPQKTISMENKTIVISDFITFFQKLNVNPYQPLIVFKGTDKEGLGNNLLSFSSALMLSIATQRGFRYIWNGGGMVSNLSEILNFPVMPQLSIANADIATVSPGCIWGIFKHPKRMQKLHECANSLCCIEMSSLLQCPIIVISSNLHYLPLFEARIGMEVRKLLPMNHTITGTLLHDFISPTDVFLEKAHNLFLQYDPSDILGVHVRAHYRGHSDTWDNIIVSSCIKQLYDNLQKKVIFLATDSDAARKWARETFSSNVIMFNYTLHSVENLSQRAESVNYAWAEAVILSKLPTKALTMLLPKSTFSHIIYAMSNPNDVVFDLSTCMHHEKGSFPQFYSSSCMCNTNTTSTFEGCSL